MGDDFVANDAAVDVEVLLVRLGVGAGGQADAAVEVHVGGAGVNRDGLFEQFVTEHTQDTRGKVASAVVTEGFAVVFQVDADACVAEGEALHELLDVGALGALAFEEFFPRRGVVEKVADFDGGAGRVCGGADGESQMWTDAPGLFLSFGAAGQGGFGDGGDTRQGLAAKAEGSDVFEVVDVLDFAGGVGGEGEGEVVGVDAAAVVADADEFAAAVFDVDIDVGRAGVNGVFDDFFDHRGGAFDDLAGGDLVDEAVGQLLDAGHGVRLFIDAVRPVRRG
ncbi:hypothetical protein HMPREF9080_01238 [Cardiobacterium valvarum F0432]|uniref:Uncharacterized protein n=1 Tax=Cardiobacterium valvarum F0432 TaxID=797473 RepID=G9ZEQ8_9GAMM|nr:hypothetical protein HMPREF9080_01238 [Cardiobacterium valvarum F0432]